MLDVEQAYQDYADVVYRYLFSLGADADLAQDLVQETFVQALRQGYRGEGSVQAFLCGIGKNLLYKEWQKRKNRPQSPLEDTASAPDDPQREALESLSTTALFVKIHHLPPAMREVVYLRLAGDLSFRAIGEIVGQSETWARVNFYRAKEKLREQE